jgi:hypothetical protein
MFTSRHNPHGQGSTHLDNGRLEEVIARYQTQGVPESLGEIVRLSQTRAQTLIRFYKTARYRPEDELLSDVNWKLLRSVSKFDPAKGSAFTFVSQVIWSTLSTSVMNARRNAKRYSELDEKLTNKLPAAVEHYDAVDDLTHRIKAEVKTTLSDEDELSTQRWYIESFTEDGFEAQRHQCANAAMTVYSLSHARSRELYDLTMLETRRVLYDDLKGRQPIPAGRLLGTRCAWMVRYAPLLTADEFTKFVILVRNLGPFILMLINPSSRSRRRDRNPTIGRENLEWVLSGHPNAVPLFRH